MELNERKDKNNECAVLVSSCDKYREAWDPFFELFHRFWPQCPYNVYLNTETEQYDKFGVNTINSPGTWGQRLASTLKKIPSDYIIFLLEDFFLQQPVKDDVIKKCLGYMAENPNIGCFYFNQIIGYKSEEEDTYEGFFRMHANDEYNDYVINCQAALWKKEYLLELVQNSDTPWDFEVEGYKNNKELIDKHEMYCIHTAHHDKVRACDVFSYVLKRETGCGIWASKWLWNNQKMFKRLGIKVQYKELKVMTYFEFVIKYKVMPFFKQHI